MKKEKIYIIKNYYKRLGQWETDNISFRDMDKAIEYCQSKLTEEENRKTEDLRKRNIISWYEFIGRGYLYEIKEIDLI